MRLTFLFIKKLIKIGLLPIGLFYASVGYTQDDFEFDADSLLVGDEATKSTFKLSDYIFGEYGVVELGASGYQRSSTIYSLGVKVPWDWGRAFVSYGGSSYELSIQQVKREGVTLPPLFPNRRAFTTVVDYQDVREASLEIDIGKYAKLTTGKVRNSWGVFEAYTPSMLILPQTRTVTSILPSKVDLMQAQEQVSLSIFPRRGLEIQIYQFGDIEGDPIEEETRKLLFITGPAKEDSDAIVGTGTIENPEFPAGAIGGIGGVQTRKAGSTVTGETGSYDATSQAFRLLAYPSWGKFGFTYFKGRDGSKSLLHTSIGFDPVREAVRNVASDSRDQDYIFYPEATMTSFEVEIPISTKWTFRFETAITDTVRGLGQDGKIYLQSAGFADTRYIPADETPATPTAAVNGFLDGVINNAGRGNLKGTILYKAQQTSTATGFIYKGAKWTSGVAMFQLTKPTPATNLDKQVVESYQVLYNQANQNTYFIDTGDRETLVLPLLGTTRTFGEEGQHRVGALSGLVGATFGAGLFYSYAFSEDLSLSFFSGPTDIEESASEFYVNEDEDSGKVVFQMSVGLRF